jgi:predicted PurR-regulated permease PerM
MAEKRPSLNPRPDLKVPSAPAPAPAQARWPFGAGREQRAAAGLTDVAFVRRVIIVIALAALAALAWRLADVLLLAFGAIVIAVILRALADVIAHYLPFARRWSLAIAVVLIFLALGAVLFLFGRQIHAQLSQLVALLPPAIEYVLGEFGVDLRNLSQQHLPNVLGSGLPREILGRAATFGLTVLGGLADLLVVVIAGAFLAASPDLYQGGFVKLFPINQHERARGALDASGRALKLWLRAQLAAMALIGLLTGGVLWLIGLPSPLALGLVAAVGEFIPFVGPILAAVPALVLAANQSMDMFLWTLAALVLIQQVESNLITPLLQREAVSLPPALSLLSVLAFAAVFGALGLVLAVPLTVVTYVLVKKLYVRETLGEETPVPGETPSEAEASAAPARPA